jgi:hypothetical protein
MLPLFNLSAEGRNEEKRDGDRGTAEQTEIQVPWFSQIEEWGETYLGDSRSVKLRTHGCALCCTAMVFRSYGIRTNPQKLNRTLLKNDAFEKGWNDDTGEYLGRVRMIWYKAAGLYDEIAGFERYNFSDGPADLELIRSYLDRGIPVIAEVLRPRGIPHFVVIRGEHGENDFLIRDPLNEETEVLSGGYDISDEHGSGAERNIFGIRVFLP